tara:strand:- start:244 stop:537 length:294 start_codon:yes stop_codon:yes gene_type:complete
MPKEYFVDRISNVSVQGSVVCLDLGRMVSNLGEKESFELKRRVTITMTGSNFISFVNSLNQTVKAISERQKNNESRTGDNPPLAKESAGIDTDSARK